MASESFIHFSESDVETTNALQLEGVWIHDPEDPEGTIHQFRFGRNNKSSSIDIGGKEQVFAGRRFPVYDFGEHQKDSVTVSVDVLHGPTYDIDRQIMRDFAEAKKTLFFRDNRGRALPGVMLGFSEKDEDFGTSFSFTIERVDEEIIEVS